MEGNALRGVPQFKEIYLENGIIEERELEKLENQMNLVRFYWKNSIIDYLINLIIFDDLVLIW